MPSADMRCVLAYFADFIVADLHARVGSSVEKRAMQHGPAYAAPRAMAERRLDVPGAVPVADPPEWLAVRVHAKPFQVPQRMRHQAFTAGLVDRPAALFDDDHFQSGVRAVDGGGQSGRAPSDDEEVDHARLASALFSTWIRVLNKTALRIVNTTAVIHAVWTSGSAMPSAITAT